MPTAMTPETRDCDTPMTEVRRPHEGQIYVIETHAANTVAGTCRNCGQRTRDAMQELCGRRNCDTVAALPITIDDSQWTQMMHERYMNDPRTQIVIDSEDPNEEPRTKAPNLMTVIRAIAAGLIHEASSDEKARATRFCEEMRGV